MIGRTGNPTLNDKTFERARGQAGLNTMTLEGTVNKSFITLVIVLGAAICSWKLYFDGGNVAPWIILGVFGGFITALIISFKPAAAPWLTPIYAALEGLFLGALSANYETAYQGITLQTALLTMCVFLALLLGYKTRVVKATENFKLGVFSATAGIAIVYVIDIALRLFGIRIPYLHDNSIIGILISLAIVVIAALNLVLDFDFIENGAKRGAPKYMEWYGAFGLVVTLVWLYVEILRLLAKLRSRN
jgi:uncharacterized YccA/Bax inhibitor family protein